MLKQQESIALARHKGGTMDPLQFLNQQVDLLDFDIKVIKASIVTWSLLALQVETIQAAAQPRGLLYQGPL